MAAEKPAPTIADYLTTALSPVLIIVMVSSLVFFLVKVLYVGDFADRLLWILFFFVFAAVFIARISLRDDISARAILYGLGAAVPTFIGLQLFVEYPEGAMAALSWGLNLILIGIVWWSTHKLTRDCTHIDDDAVTGEEGLLQAAGLDDKDKPQLVDPSAEPASDEAKPLTWWQRFQEYREKKRQKRTPGLWVVYFSLAALPLFGLGQALIPVADEERRRFVFWLMVLYLGSGLGLLMTTCFLGLRKYLRQRQVRMTTTMTFVWLATGIGLIVTLLVIGAVLPRPQAEYSVLEAVGLTSPKKDASQYSVLGDSPGQGDGRPGSQGPKEGQDPGSKSDNGGKPGQGEPNSQDPNAKPGNSGSKDGQGPKNGGNQQGTQQGNAGKGEQGQKTEGQNPQGGPKSTGQQGQAGKQPQDKNKPETQDGNKPKPPEEQRNAESDPSGQPQQTQSSNPLQALLSFLMWIGSILKWIVFGVLALVVLFVVGRALLKFLANFSTWAKDLLAWWRSLFAGRSDDTGEAGADPSQPSRTWPPFSQFPNPFENGNASRWSPDKLVRYSFDALQAWAYERDLGRRPDETPLEFAQRLGNEVPALEADVRRLAGLVVRSLYARGDLTKNCREVVQKFWDKLESVAEQPLSA